MTVVDITSKAQFQELIEKSPYVAVQAHATWCGPCKAIAPLFNKQADSLSVADKYTFARFDIEDVEDLSQELGIRSIPAFFFFENGEKANSLVGSKPAELKKAVEELSAKATAVSP